MTKAISQINQMHKEKVLFWTLSGFLLLSAVLYMYCVQSTVRNVVSGQTLEAEASHLALSMGAEEFKYISMRNSINLDAAKQLGFTETDQKKFISPSSLGFVSMAQKGI